MCLLLLAQEMFVRVATGHAQIGLNVFLHKDLRKFHMMWIYINYHKRRMFLSIVDDKDDIQNQL